MTESELLSYCRSKLAVTEGYPFGEGILVFKVANKMFAIVSQADDPIRVNLKCDPAEALALRDVFESVIPGYHMNKVHWNTVITQGDVPDGELKRQIDNSYQLIVKSLPKKIQQTIC
ncbi:MmcQ/YjbR family DNA-binding protein [Aliikangiella sp. IMCC44653]